MKVGINLWTIYGWGLPEFISPEVLRSIGKLGVRGVELVLDEAANSVDQLLSRRDAVQSVLSECGLEVPSVASARFWVHNLASQDPAVRKHGLDHIRDGCQVTEAYGARVFLVVAGQGEPRTEYARTYATAVASLREAAGYAADRGVVIGVENVGTNLICSPGEYAQFLADVDHPAVQAYLDFGNGFAVGNGYAENWITAMRGRIAMVHAKDYDRSAHAYVCCGQGDIPWEDVFASLRAVGYDDYVTVETPPLGGRAQLPRAVGLAAAENSARWLTRFV